MNRNSTTTITIATSASPSSDDSSNSNNDSGSNRKGAKKVTKKPVARLVTPEEAAMEADYNEWAASPYALM
jgi:hypothetical protein